MSAQRAEQAMDAVASASDQPTIRTRPSLAPRALGSALALALLAGWLLVGLPLYVFPGEADDAGADLIYVIGPATPARIAQAERMRDAGVADRILLSTPNSKGPYSAAGTPECQLAWVSCGMPEPRTTKGEARMLQDYAAAHGVGKTIVLTYTPHVARTRYVFGRCYAGDAVVDPVDEGLQLAQWAQAYVYQTAAFAKAWATGC